MRFTIDKEQFLKGLLITGHSIGNKNPNPMYLCFKLELTARGLEIPGSNGAIPTWTLVPNMLNDKEVVRKLEGTEVSMEIIDNVIAKIDDGKATFKLNCISSEEYPHIDFEKAGNPFVLSCADVTSLVAQTAFAALDKVTRPILMAINLRAEGGRLDRKSVV